MSIPHTKLPSNAFDSAHMLRGWDGPQGGAGQAVVHQGRVLYAVPDSQNYLTLLTSDLATYQQTHAVTDLNQWAVQNVADWFPTALKPQLQVASFLSAVALGDYVYVAWHNPAGYFALRVRPGSQERPTLAPLELSAFRGFTFGSNPALLVLPDYEPAYAGKLGLVALALNPQKNGRLMAAVLDPATFAANTPWVPGSYDSQYWPGVPNVAPGDGSGAGLVSNYPYLSAAILNQGDYQATDGKNVVPLASLVLTFHQTKSSSEASCVSAAADLWYVFDHDYRVKKNIAQHLDLAAVPGLGDIHPDSGATLVNTPDGQVLAMYYGAGNDQSKILTMRFAPTDTPADYSAVVHNPSWQNLRSTSFSGSATNTPCSVYVPLAPVTGPSPCPVPKTDDPQSTESFPDCVTWNYVQCTFTSGQNNGKTHLPLLLTSYWGCVFTARGYRTGTRPKDQTPKALLSLLADAFPYPVPDTQLWGTDSPSGMVNWALCSYDYLVGDQTEVDLNFTLRGRVGVKVEGVSLVGGVGVRGEATAGAGFELASRYADTTRRATSYSIGTKALPAGLADKSHPTLPDSLAVSNAGALFGTQPPATVFVDHTMVLLRDQNRVEPISAAAVRPLLDDSVSAVAGEFVSYCYTPGNLLSYQPERLDDSMRTQYHASMKDDFFVDGTDYSYLYTNGNYLKDVVEAFGMNCFGPTGNLPYLEFSFSEAGIQRSEFQSTSAFTLGGAAFTDGSLYGGLAWKQSVEAQAGVVVAAVTVRATEAEGFFLVGAEYYSEVASSGTSTSDWGVMLGEYLNPLAPGESYTVRMYILKPSALWARELKNFSSIPTGAVVDTDNSQPVRILFSVLNISPTLATRLAPLDRK